MWDAENGQHSTLDVTNVWVGVSDEDYKNDKDFVCGWWKHFISGYDFKLWGKMNSQTDELCDINEQRYRHSMSVSAEVTWPSWMGWTPKGYSVVEVHLDLIKVCPVVILLTLQTNDRTHRQKHYHPFCLWWWAIHEHREEHRLILMEGNMLMILFYCCGLWSLFRLHWRTFYIPLHYALVFLGWKGNFQYKRSLKMPRLTQFYPHNMCAVQATCMWHPKAQRWSHLQTLWLYISVKSSNFGF